MFALLMHYYSMTPDDVSNLTPTQINYLLDMVAHVSPWSDKAGKAPTHLPEDLHKLALDAGMDIPLYKESIKKDDDKTPMFMGE